MKISKQINMMIKFLALDTLWLSLYLITKNSITASQVKHNNPKSTDNGRATINICILWIILHDLIMIFVNVLLVYSLIRKEEKR